LQLFFDPFFWPKANQPMAEKTSSQSLLAGC